MAQVRKIEVFSAGCSVCQDAVREIKAMGCEACDITVLDMKDSQVATRARELGIRSVPAVVIDGELASCCAGRGIDINAIRAACGERSD